MRVTVKREGADELADRLGQAQRKERPAVHSPGDRLLLNGVEEVEPDVVSESEEIASCGASCGTT